MMDLIQKILSFIAILVTPYIAYVTFKRPKKNEHYNDYHKNVLSPIYSLVWNVEKDIALENATTILDKIDNIIGENLIDVPHELAVRVKKLKSTLHSGGPEWEKEFEGFKEISIYQNKKYKKALGYPKQTFRGKDLTFKTTPEILGAFWILSFFAICGLSLLQTGITDPEQAHTLIMNFALKIVDALFFVNAVICLIAIPLAFVIYYLRKFWRFITKLLKKKK